MKFGLILSVLVVLGAIIFFSTNSSNQITSSVSGSGKKPNVHVSDEVLISETLKLPLSGSAPEINVPYIIELNKIRQGCRQQECIPSVDSPEFTNITEASKVLPNDTIGIALAYKGVDRYYPFPMLETHELVNDVVAGDALLVSYCPLCGTGIVFDRTIDGQVVEFGVSGMLWQSNLLMYNRAENLDDRNLWSQVLGQAVVGKKAGEHLSVVSSDIMRFSEWIKIHPQGEVLTTGLPQDPYGGNYLRTAFSFSPDFDLENSQIAPDTYVYGVTTEPPIAFVADSIKEGTTTITIGSDLLEVVKSSEGSFNIFTEGGMILPDVEGFWFSWSAAHPDTQLWNNILIQP